MDLLRMADEYQTLANEHTGFAGHAAENAANYLRSAHQACQQADGIIIAAVHSGDDLEPIVA